MDDLAAIDCPIKDDELNELVVLGVTHGSLANLEDLASLVIGVDYRGRRLTELREVLDAEEMAYLATCNRVAFVLITRRSPDTLVKVARNWYAADAPAGSIPSTDQWIALRGRAALEHLLRVASSVDSMVVGERQVFGQYKEAFREAGRLRLIGPKLQFLFDQSIRVAKAVYSSTALSRGKLSVVSLTEERLARACRERPSGRVVLVGAGPMIEKSAAFLAGQAPAGLTFVNRTPERARALAEQFGGVSMSLEQLLDKPPAFDILVTSTAAPRPLLDEGFFRETAHGSPRLVIDLAVPPDVEPSVGAAPDIELVTMETLRGEAGDHEARRREAVAEATEILERRADEIVERWRVWSVNPAIGRLTKRYIQETNDELDRLIETKLSHLNEAQKNELTRWATTMAKRWAVIQAAGVKETARSCCLRAAAAYLEAVGVEEEGS